MARSSGPASRGPGQRAGLNRETVIAAAGELVANAGLAALTMRAVATRLGVTPNAIYSHVDSKTALLDGVLDELLQQVDSPAAGPSPTDALHELMTATYRVLLSRPDLVPLYLARQGTRGPHAERLGESMAALLERVAVTGPAARDAIRVLVVYTIGFAAVAAGPAIGLALQDGPLPAGEADRSFDDGLRWLLTGIVSSATGVPTTPQPAPETEFADTPHDVVISD